MYLAGSVAAVWFCGLIFFTGRALNLMRLVLNNLAPGEPLWGTGDVKSITPLGGEFRIQASAVDPAGLSELGKIYRKQAIRNERMMFAWGFGGFILIGSLFWYAQTSGAGS